MFIEQPPQLVRALYPRAVWRMDATKKVVYLTFDDGPIPEVTPWVLELLDKYEVKATFFMVGDNAYKYPEICRKVIDNGHRIGNHTYNHIRGSEYLSENYLANVEKANELLKTDLFRPPHGDMRRKQYFVLASHYRIIMWDLVTRDYNNKLDGEEVFRKVKKYVRNGSIITFHDSLKAEKNMKYALPHSIEWLQQQGFSFGLL
ncbi:MAG: polysaccharide deacetylase family protein [Mediterranea sp.]|nr:polysaccharide deacetylase family protein [Mediterranea sp.]